MATSPAWLQQSFDRRGFVQLGAFALGGLLMPGGSKANASSEADRSKAIINIHLAGGPSHQDIFDLKPKAPREFAGEFSPIATNVPGIEICEHLPQLAGMADRWAVIRSLVGMHGEHSNRQTQTGYGAMDFRNVGGAPSIGSVVGKVMGPTATGAPNYVAFNEDYRGYLGATYGGYKPQGTDLRVTRGLTEERIENRTSLLTQLDSLRRDVDNRGQMDAFDGFTRRAVEVVTSGKVADALDIQKAEPKSLARYGGNENRNFLLARRLVEAGVRAVSFSIGGWDTHANNFKNLKKLLGKLDTGLAALVGDLHATGLDRDVTVAVWGEFGRTPRVNKTAGRDHWPKVSMCFLAGGGMRTGQVIGATNDTAAEAKERPVHAREVIATLYRNLGINPATTQLIDPSGRPQYLVDHRPVIGELV